MKIAFIGPVFTKDVAHLLGPSAAGAPKGWQGAPLMATLITMLVEAGHEVVAITLTPDLSPSIAAPVRVQGPRLVMHYVPRRTHAFRFNFPYPGFMLDCYARERQFFRQALEADRPEVIQAHWSYETALAAQDSGLPYVLTCHDEPLTILRFVPDLYRFARLLVARKVLPHARVVTAVSPYLCDALARSCKVPIRMIPNPLPVSLIGRPDRGPPAAGELDSPHVAMVVNGWGGFKNPLPGLFAFAQFKRAVPGATLHVYGHGFGPGQRAEQFARRKGIADGIVFHGMTVWADLMQQLGTMHLLMHPSLWEACPMALVEAMTAGLVVVGGNHSGGVPWVLDDGQAGILTDVRKPAAIAEAMIALVRDPTRYATLRRRGWERAQTAFDPPTILRGYEAAYREALAVWGKPS